MASTAPWTQIITEFAGNATQPFVNSKIGAELDFRAGPDLPCCGVVIIRLRRRSHPTYTYAYTYNNTMASRASANATALRRLMTEYKQLTAGGLSLSLRSFTFSLKTTHVCAASQVRPTACSQPVRTMIFSRERGEGGATIIFRVLTAQLLFHFFQARSPNLTFSPGRPSFAGQRIPPS